MKRWVPILAALFAFRLLFGLSSEFFFEDETQIYLLGLRYYATGHWPFFGPDVVWTKSEIPGALQALLVGVPLAVAPIPEAPFVLLNLLSFGALAALAWYTCEHLPHAPRWLIWGWFLTRAVDAAVLDARDQPVVRAAGGGRVLPRLLRDGSRAQPAPHPGPDCARHDGRRR